MICVVLGGVVRNEADEVSKDQIIQGQAKGLRVNSEVIFRCVVSIKSP